MKILYEKIEIHSAADLPKEEDVCFCHVKSLSLSENGMDIMEWRNNPYEWINTFDWYLLPVRDTPEKTAVCPRCESKNIFSVIQNHHKCKDCKIRWTTDIEGTELRMATLDNFVSQSHQTVSDENEDCDAEYFIATKLNVDVLPKHNLIINANEIANWMEEYRSQSSPNHDKCTNCNKSHDYSDGECYRKTGKAT